MPLGVVAPGRDHAGEVHLPFAQGGHVRIPQAGTVLEVQQRRAGAEAFEHPGRIGPADLDPVHVHLEEHLRREMLEEDIRRDPSLHLEVFPPVIVNPEGHAVGRNRLRGLVETVRRPPDAVYRAVVVPSQSRDHPFRSDRPGRFHDIGRVVADGQGQVRARYFEIQRFEQSAGRLRRGAGKTGRLDPRVSDLRGQVHHALIVLVGQFSEGIQLQGYGRGHNAAPLSVLAATQGCSNKA